MDGFPVVIRTLDPRLDEFLPQRREPHGGSGQTASRRYQDQEGNVGELQDPGWRTQEEAAGVVAAGGRTARVQPMLGHRGCRLGIAYPEITEMQARAIFEAVVQVAKKGVKVIPEVMIPLIGSVEEFDNQAAIVRKVADEVLGKAGMKDQHYLVGTMIEIPRAALLADQVAKSAEFFSFGTNDLTQTTMGLSRDDYTKFQKIYEEHKIFKADPFAVLDQQGVGKLVEMATKNGKKARPGLEVGICGEHGGEPSSVAFCYKVGMDYVSCSPYRVPIARLAAAQAAISDEKGEAMRTA
jgi:pyruvate,orthophosphate dikinase